MTPSALLTREATSSLPELVSWGLIIWVASVVTIRQIVLVYKRPVDTAAHILVALLLVTAVLRQGGVQTVLMHLGVSLGSIRVLTHTAAIGSAASLLIVGILWNQGQVLNWRRIVPILVAAVLGCGVILYLLAWPATSKGLAVEELLSWRTGAYMAVYSFPTPLAAVAAAMTAFAHVRQHVSWSRTIFGLVCLLCIAGSMFDHMSRLVSGLVLATGTQNAFTEARTHTNDLFFLPVVALLAWVGIPSVVSSIRVRLGKDSAARNARILQGMWTQLSEAVTDVGVPATHDVPVDSSFIEHRMFIDIEDAVYALLPHLPKAEGDSPQDNARDLRIAAQRARAGEPPLHERDTAPPWLQESRKVLAVAAAWNEQERDQQGWMKTL